MRSWAEAERLPMHKNPAKGYRLLLRRDLEASFEQRSKLNIPIPLRDQLENGVSEQEMCIIVRSDKELPRAIDAVSRAGCKSRKLDDASSKAQNAITVATMHLSKGLEYRAVVVMACDDEVIPLQSRIESVGDDADLQEVYATERQLLYVACTRARDFLLVSGVTPASEFLDDFEEE